MFSKTLIAAFAAGLFTAANAHLAMSSPQPIPGSNSKSPLDPSGSDFPCQGTTTGGTTTPMSAGSSQTLAFDLGQGANTAVHGGGSCQISLSYETDAAKLKDPANWKVIHSFVGGCPSSAMGNLETAVACPANDQKCIESFNFSIPSEVKNGKAILAWTWFNNIGNREMYMNCASVSISGGSDKMDSLPGLFVANLANINTCKTTEQATTDFPNPGSYVTKPSTLNYPLKAPAGECGTGSGSGSSGSTGGSNTGSGTTPVASSTPNDGQYAGEGAASSTPKATPQASSSPGGAFAEGANPAAPVATTLATKASSAAAAGPTVGAGSGSGAGTGGGKAGAGTGGGKAGASPAQPAASPSNSGFIGNSGSCPSGSVACTTQGFYCIDADTFGQCNWGCAVPQKMAGGTSCSNGAVSHKVQPRQPSIRGRLARRNGHQHRQHEHAS